MRPVGIELPEWLIWLSDSFLCRSVSEDSGFVLWLAC